MWAWSNASRRSTSKWKLGFTAEEAALEVQRCLNCDVQTVFAAKLCIECDACIDICPVDCLTITQNGPEADLRSRLTAPAANPSQALYVSAALPQTARVMVKDEDVCVHWRLCAERCPTAAWDMQKIDHLHSARHRRGAGRMPSLTANAGKVNDFVVKFANVNGTGSASAIP